MCVCVCGFAVWRKAGNCQCLLVQVAPNSQQLFLETQFPVLPLAEAQTGLEIEVVDFTRGGSNTPKD